MLSNKLLFEQFLGSISGKFEFMKRLKKMFFKFLNAYLILLVINVKQNFEEVGFVCQVVPKRIFLISKLSFYK